MKNFFKGQIKNGAYGSIFSSLFLKEKGSLNVENLFKIFAFLPISAEFLRQSIPSMQDEHH